ncbi:2-oxoglutarate dehydrogenase complex dihydrolipoyllysine-residue succinyltransferase [Mammaliicoccus stepanovicii]|uniref:Dihydrolipoyllysine-residue succinyltransferase component of 2-oxoglutarate dehydrogenase complex n=1 Tax=Mammaliicoccus stepanovicii TaxID=643214 RepID=A0A239ZBW2_9STAP|nr:2-oxoglutarate dehydrogenase complex dihydrolipoyllysine-residue succinyltransferase [Mammaliicoccus stepanovicii]PNZ73877.1 dihydrolipoyllysine-residue succinyltransferase [Mammaliicoccus stepanovicii]GGI42164.1 dihydrolipoyllysine-residue succinyltransferase component of 2-oxoglutarate dehydrogenase complex [Mammaliicoccus stepanovicii]SNV68204.1 dihydrolipoamide succinyltransferase [Mammaliicoccus stepanovicii]
MSEVKVPELAESITEGTISEWLKAVGDQVEKGENIVELETDKVNVEVISESAGVLTEIKAEEGDTVEVGSVIAIVSEDGEATPANNEGSKSNESKEDKQVEPPKEDAAKEVAVSNDNSSSNERIQATPSARKLAREKGIDLSKVKTQAGDVIRPEDVESAAKPATQSKPASQNKPAQSNADINPSKPVIREKLSRRRQTIAKKLLEVSNNTAMLTTFNEVDMTNVMELRKRKKDKFQEDHNGTRLGFMSFFTKAAVAALKKYPDVNAEIDGTDLLLKQFYDIGIAVSTEEGLVVPIVKDCDKKNFAEIEQNIYDLAVKAKDKKLGLDDMMGGSFTITNGGVFGSLMSTPIINGTQAAILGMHSIVTRPVAIDKERMENRPMMYIALSYDHRIIDGKQAVGFLKTIKDLIENPEDLLLES